MNPCLCHIMGPPIHASVSLPFLAPSLLIMSPVYLNGNAPPCLLCFLNFILSDQVDAPSYLCHRVSLLFSSFCSALPVSQYTNSCISLGRGQLTDTDPLSVSQLTSLLANFNKAHTTTANPKMASMIFFNTSRDHCHDPELNRS